MRSPFSILVFSFLFLLATACERHNVATSAEIETFRSGSLGLGAHEDAPSTIYVDLGGDQRGITAAELGSALARSHFSLVSSPSKAGYILHLTVLDAGVVSPGRLQQLVKAGYGAESRFSGQGGTGLLADALLVQRRVPSAKRPSHARLKNITTRNAIESAQMRIGMLLPGEFPRGAAVGSIFADRLAEELHRALSTPASPAPDKKQKSVGKLAAEDK